jgi:hypothetical protein
MAVLWNLSGTAERDLLGRGVPGAKAYFLQPGTVQTPKTVYQDADLSTPHQHPVTADGFGVWPAVFFSTGRYKIRRVKPAGTVISEMDGVDGAPTPSEGGGGGDQVDETALFQTGDLKLSSRTDIVAGWVRLNARTIGSAASGASERANADCEALFKHLWDNFADAICPVTGGRGSTATADWSANKVIQVPPGAGYLLGIVEAMGGTAPNKLQIATTITTTNASTSATVASAAGLTVGMYVISANVPDGATITAINGTTITLSAAASAPGTGTAVRFSILKNAEALGATGGTISGVLTEAQLPAVTKNTNTTGSHTHTYVGHNSAVPALGDGPSVLASTATRTTSAAGEHAHTVAFGGDQAHPNLPPVALYGGYIKL